MLVFFWLLMFKRFLVDLFFNHLLELQPDGGLLGTLTKLSLC